MTAAPQTRTTGTARMTMADARPSPRHMAWALTAGAAALSLILGTALPVRAADKDDIAKALIAALVIGTIIHETKDREDGVKPAVEPPVEPVRKKKRPRHGPLVPAVCALEFEGERRSVTVYPESCLIRRGVEGRLPEYCAREARIWDKRDRVYSEDCLREAGFRFRDDRDNGYGWYGQDRHGRDIYGQD